MKTYEIATQREIIPLYVDIKKALDKGRAVRVEIKSTASKTTDQLGYYWAVVLPRIQQGMQENGNELGLAQINQMLNEKFFCITNTASWTDAKGVQHVHVIRTPRSKSGATKDEMARFLDEVIRWASVELGVYIPDPNCEPPF